MSDALIKNLSNLEKNHGRRRGRSNQKSKNTSSDSINPFFQSLSTEMKASAKNGEISYGNKNRITHSKNDTASEGLLNDDYQISNASASENKNNGDASYAIQACNERSTDSFIPGGIRVFPSPIRGSIATKYPLVYSKINDEKGSQTLLYPAKCCTDENNSNHESPKNEEKTSVKRKYACFNLESCQDKDKDKAANKRTDLMSQLLLSNNSKTGNVTRKKLQRSVSTCVELVKLHFSDVENRLFEMFGNKESKIISLNNFFSGLLATGLRIDDPRLKEMYENVQAVKMKHNKVEDDSLTVDYHTFMGVISQNLEVVVRAFGHSFVIPDFRTFCGHIDEIYMKCKSNEDGEAASYIPQLSRMNKDFWAVSLCTVDGQRHSVGDVNVPFTVQSCSKPLTYAIACVDNGPDKMHKYIGLEPSGRFFNELCLDFSNKPHNPMINSGAIMTAALVKPEYSAADKFHYMFEMYQRLAAGEYLGFNNSVFLSEKECADRNFALGYFMREKKCFPPETKLQEILELYFQLCSLEITAESGAVMAATLANGGINPLSGDPVLTCEAVRNTLTLMHSCGMYNYSGQFAFKVGLPAKSGVSGCILLVVPNTLGICLWSPALDLNGNSCRGVQFCSELVNLFKFHHFDNLRGNTSSSDKIDPRVTKAESSAQILFDLLFCVAANDISSLRRHALAGTDLESADYDGRTALHVAASEGHIELVEFLLEKCHVNPAPKDRWQRTPVEDARLFGHPLVVELLEIYCKQQGIETPPTQSKLTNCTT